MKLALNAIVRNEADNIRRLLVSVLPHVNVVIIVDTGSSDDTIAIIHQECKTWGVPCEIHHTNFLNFSQARNFALDRARESKADFTHILLADADMELVVHDNALCEYVGDAHAYFMVQQASGLAYHNVRIVKRDWPATYIGVTHEYLDLAGDKPATMTGAFWIDHASGSNRTDKCQRDIRLLLDDIKTSPKNPRSWFYLAQSYRDSGQYQKAINAFRRRIELGDWVEEVWHSQLEIARCYLKLGNNDKFVVEAIKAADMRPTRAEPLYDLAKFYREAGSNRASTVFSKAALGLAEPSAEHALFVEQAVYKWGVEYEYAITAFYDERERAAGFTACDHISLCATAPQNIRDQAKSNLFFYTPMLGDIAKWEAHQIAFAPPDGYRATNPSVTVRGNRLYCVVRCVNYEITPSGHYDMKGDTAIRTRNFLVDIPGDMSTELLVPDDWPEKPAYDQVIGFEDMRLSVWQDRFFVNACVRELNSEGWCEQVTASIDEATGALYDWRVMRPADRHGGRSHQKNWVPVVVNNRRRFMYRPSLMVSSDGSTFSENDIGDLSLDDMSGGSQLIPYNGGWLTVSHESGSRPDGQRWYRHRFVWYDPEFRPARVSKPFCLNHKGIEFVAGLARDPNNGSLMISYGVDDREAWIGKISTSDVRDLLWTSAPE